jgi:Rrf2 family protein
MKLSTRGRYGVRLMLDLALHDGQGPVLLKDIARRQGISEKYLWNLINPLKTVGLGHSIRGAHGGYKLAKKPSEISLKDIMQVLEGTLCLVDCVETPSACERSYSCITRDVWREASQNFMKTLESMTLEKMIAKHRSRAEATAEYSI